MKNWLAWLKKHAFEVHSLAFTLMIVSSACLYLAARSGASALVMGWLGVFIAANVVVALLK